jgi:tRNA pseudouridine32 synthase / 23S rRNA pseudouridine746 synthase
MPSPFDDVAPHPLAQRAAQALMQQLAATPDAFASLHRPEGGKMFGVLVVEAPDGRLGVLRGFSGQLEATWPTLGFVAPLSDTVARTTLEHHADLAVKALTRRLEAFEASPAYTLAHQVVAQSLAAHAEAKAQLKARHAQRQADRQRARAATTDPVALHALDEQSRFDDRERRQLEARFRTQHAALVADLARLERHRLALSRLRRVVSQEAMRRIADQALLTNTKGERSTVRERFSPAEPSWGAGDCAAPRLLQAAIDEHLRPVALAEFWWGSPPAGGGRVQGMFFPACREKCGPLLPFLLDGLPVAERQTWKPRFIERDALEVLHEDERFLVVLKPEGLLSVPARDATITDSVLARLRRRFPNASGSLLVHRLDLDTSGLLLAALDAEAFTALQAQFIARTVHKRYLALLDGVVAEDHGVIDLPLRVDLEQRPRQLVDEQFGKPARTEWAVLSRGDGETRVALFPLTGRTHQLRVHLSHPRGLGVPIKGDRLYGRPSTRLYLHAESLRFRHPTTGVLITVESKAPF